MAVQLPPKYLLGEFELEPDKYLLRRGNEYIHLPELPFQVLLYLVERRDRFISRHELLEKFWAGSESYEETLTKCISMIRTQLNDPPAIPRYIETRKKVGYRYIGPFEQLADNKSLAREPYVEVETTRRVSVSIEEEDDLASMRRIANPAPLPIENAVPRWKKPLLASLAAVSLVVASSLLLSRWSPGTAPVSEQTINSIAVLPLKNLSGDPANDYFGDGVTESLIMSLSKFENLRVQSRSSVFRFKNEAMDPLELGRQLNVATVLEGSVRKLGNSVRVAVRLVSVEDGRVLWASDEQERSLGDVLALQDEIARNVATGLRLRLSGEAQQQLARRYTENIQAYELYLQGRFNWNNYTTQEDLLRAIKYFEAAIVKDANYALAYSGLADAHIALALDWRVPREVLPQAQQYAQKALALDQSLGEAHFSRGAVAYFYEWNWVEAERELERALTLNAKSLEANACYLHSLEPTGAPQSDLINVRRALDQNPLSTYIHGELSCGSYYARRYDQALEFSQETLKLDRTYLFASYNRARALGQKQRYEEAIAELNKIVDVGGRTTSLLSELGYVYGKAGRRQDALKLLQELQTRSAREYIDPYPLAFLYVGLGNNDGAIKSLEKAYEARSIWIPWLKVEPKFDSLRSDPRFISLIKRLKLDS